MIKLKKKPNIKKRPSKKSLATLSWVCLPHVLGPIFLSFFFLKKKDNMLYLFVLKKITCLAGLKPTTSSWTHMLQQTRLRHDFVIK
jgi:hypothetical protein